MVETESEFCIDGYVLVEANRDGLTFRLACPLPSMRCGMMPADGHDQRRVRHQVGHNLGIQSEHLGR